MYCFFWTALVICDEVKRGRQARNLTKTGLSCGNLSNLPRQIFYIYLHGVNVQKGNLHFLLSYGGEIYMISFNRPLSQPLFVSRIRVS